MLAAECRRGIRRRPECNGCRGRRSASAGKRWYRSPTRSRRRLPTCGRPLQLPFDQVEAGRRFPGSGSWAVVATNSDRSPVCGSPRSSVSESITGGIASPPGGWHRQHDHRSVCRMVRRRTHDQGIPRFQDSVERHGSGGRHVPGHRNALHRVARCDEQLVVRPIKAPPADDRRDRRRPAPAPVASRQSDGRRRQSERFEPFRTVGGLVQMSDSAMKRLSESGDSTLNDCRSTNVGEPGLLTSRS